MLQPKLLMMPIMDPEHLLPMLLLLLQEQLLPLVIRILPTPTLALKGTMNLASRAAGLMDTTTNLLGQEAMATTAEAIRPAMVTLQETAMEVVTMDETLDETLDEILDVMAVMVTVKNDLDLRMAVETVMDHPRTVVEEEEEDMEVSVIRCKCCPLGRSLPISLPTNSY
jgi:hypothetical protein